MKKTITLFILGITIICSRAFAIEPEHMKKLVNNNSAFAIDLYQKLSAKEGNIFISPYSISTALTMTYAGARGNTEKEMAKTLRLSLDQKTLYPAFAKMESELKQIKANGNVKLNIVNSLWPQKEYTFLNSYLSLIRNNFDAAITPVDYKRSPEAARKMINRWVENRTQDNIKNLIPPGILDDLTRLVLVNAIYFKGNWASQFHAGLTANAPFFISPQTSVQAPLMLQTHKFMYADIETVQVLEMPYAGKELSMIVLLPKNNDGLQKLESMLALQNLKRWKNSLREVNVRVYLPKFKITSMFRLDQALVSMGMIDAFKASMANFSGMDGNPDGLYIGAVLHKAFLTVDEVGTEAAAATGVVMQRKSAPVRPPVFRADHPFLFLIQENSTGSILFIGRITDPTR